MLAAFVLAALLEASGGAAQVSDVGAPAEAPRFVERPSLSQLAAAYPHGAANLGVGGHAVLHCHVGEAGRLQDCALLRESPSGAGFGTAALSLARYFRVDPQSLAALSGQVDLPISFATANKEDELLVTGPWVAAPTFDQAGQAYPDIGGGAAGVAQLHCALTRSGALQACRTVYLQPVDRDFDKAALKLASHFLMRIDPAYLKLSQPMGANLTVRLPAPFGEEYKARRLTDPAWLALPDAARLSALYPAAAQAKGVAAGSGDALCQVGVDGVLAACKPDGEGDPPGLGFADAAAKAAGDMRMSPWTDGGGPVDGVAVRVRVRFSAAR